MRRRPLFWKLFPIYFLITLASVLAVGFYSLESLREFYYTEAGADLEIRARLIAEDLREYVSAGSSSRLQSHVRSLGRSSSTRITVVAPDGTVLADSDADPPKMENHGDRPEVIAALEGRVGRVTKVSPALGTTMVYRAIAIERGGKVAAVLRIARPATALDSAPSEMYRQVVIGALLVSLLAGLVSILAARKISVPLTQMKEAAAKFADGDFRSRVPPSDTEEFASLADTLNRMATQLDQYVRTISQHTGEQQAILSSMREGVVAIDDDDRILILNATAEQMLGVSAEVVKGMTIQEAIRNPDLQRFFVRSHDSSGPIIDEIALRGPEERLMQVIGSSLLDVGGRRIGVLVVLNDITQTRKLENLRRDFVANVSHELKTPITSIKGFVETLREGAVKDHDKAQAFLDIIARQADRLHAIIEDLLALSKIEQTAEAEVIPVSLSSVNEILQAAVTNCLPKARECDVDVTIECDEHLTARLNAPLVEQAVTNLVDNAIKYSPGGSVNVLASRTDGELAISVVDTGVGIEPEHIPRLFERFYRVDRARSRKLGGTGLGLAIVKHIVQAHAGRIEVDSTPGEGSTFTMFVPA